MISARCKGSIAKSYCRELEMTQQLDTITTWLCETDEMREICVLKDEFSLNEYHDISGAVAAIQIDGFVPEFAEFLDILQLLVVTKGVLQFFKKTDAKLYPYLKRHTRDVVFPQFVLDRIEQTFSKDGKIKDRASKALAEIRSQLINNKQHISKKLASLLDVFHKEKWLSSDLSPSLVNGRTVLPIDSSYKRKIAGLVHDESASGKTSYIEPAEIVELNNRQRELELEELREIQKILRELAGDIAPYSDVLLHIQETIARIDFIRAKALLAIEMDAVKPAVYDDMEFLFHQARNALLVMAYKPSKKTVVPLNVELSSSQHIMLISGPNAGGKSVAMKTVILLQYMMQCGILIPCGGNTRLGIAHDFFLEMGDDQSLDNDLSTYSAHLLHLKNILLKANHRSLVGIDELGGGTEPLQGGAIAEAILKELIEKQCFGVISTHYTNLKIFAAENNGIANGAMLMNADMTPSFVFQAGLPGNSFALEIAHRIGLPAHITEYARKKTGPGHQQFDALLRKVMKDKRYYERKRIAVRQHEKKLEQLTTDYEQRILVLQKERRKILDEAKRHSDLVVKQLNSTIENTIRAIKEANAEKEKTKILRKELDSKVQNLASQIEITITDPAIAADVNKLPKEPEIVNIDANEIHIGSRVRIVGTENIGEVSDLGEHNAVVRFGNIITSIAQNKLEKIHDEKPATTRSGGSAYKNIKEIRDNFKPYTDLRGMNSEEAIVSVTAFVDDAIVLGVSQIKILHGKGDGILRKNIREYLKTIKQVQYFADEDIRFGGDGITVVQLKT